MSRPKESSYRIDFSKVYLDPDLRNLVYREDYGNVQLPQNGDPEGYERTKNILKTKIITEIEKIQNKRSSIHPRSLPTSPSNMVVTEIGKIRDFTVPGGTFNFNAYYEKAFGKDANKLKDEKHRKAYSLRLAVDNWTRIYSQYRYVEPYMYECFFSSEFFKDFDKDLWDNFHFIRFSPDRFAVYVARMKLDLETALGNEIDSKKDLRDKFNLFAVIAVCVIIYALLF